MRLVLGVLVALAITPAAMVACAQAQGTPSPGPNGPAQPQGRDGGKTMVINPTEEECRKGWNANLKWTREVFDDFCRKMRMSK